MNLQSLNLLEILYLVAEHDDIVKARLSKGPQNARYTSPEIPNFLLTVMGSMVQGIICNNVRAAGHSIMADECKRY